MNASVAAACEPKSNCKSSKWINTAECEAVLIGDVYNITPEEKAALREFLNVAEFVKLIVSQTQTEDVNAY